MTNSKRHVFEQTFFDTMLTELSKALFRFFKGLNGREFIFEMVVTATQTILIFQVRIDNVIYYYYNRSTQYERANFFKFNVFQIKDHS